MPVNNNPTKFVAYDDNYIDQLFIEWQMQGRPSSTKFIESESCPKDRLGRKPAKSLIDLWITERGWRERADVIDALAATQIDDELVALKVNMLRKQAAQSAEVREKAFAYILEQGFDSAASAVSAFIKASELERITLGISKTVQKLSEMDDDEVLQTVKELAERAGQITIDAEEVSEQESEDAEP